MVHFGQDPEEDDRLQDDGHGGDRNDAREAVGLDEVLGALPGLWDMGGEETDGGNGSCRPRAVLKGGGGDLRNANRNDRSREHSLLHGHGTFSTSKVGGWQLVVGGRWRVAVGGRWELAVLVIGGSWLVGVGGRRLAVGGSWRLAVGGPWGLSLKAVLSKKRIWPLKDSPMRTRP